MSFLAGFYGAKALQEQENNKAWRQIWQEDRRLDLTERQLDISEDQLAHTMAQDDWENLFRQQQHEEDSKIRWEDIDLRRTIHESEEFRDDLDRAENLFRIDVEAEGLSKENQLRRVGYWQNRADEMYEAGNSAAGDMFAGYALNLETRLRDTPFASEAEAINVIISGGSPGASFDEHGRPIFIPEGYVEQAYQYLIDLYPDVQSYQDAYDDFLATKDERLEEHEAEVAREAYMRTLDVLKAENTVREGSARADMTEDDALVSSATVGERIRGVTLENTLKEAGITAAELANTETSIRLKYFEDGLRKELDLLDEQIRGAANANELDELLMGLRVDLMASELALSESEVRVSIATEFSRILGAELDNELAQANIDTLLQRLGIDAETHSAEMTRFIAGVAAEGLTQVIEAFSDDLLESAYPDLTVEESRALMMDLAEEAKAGNLSEAELNARLKEAEIRARLAAAMRDESQAALNRFTASQPVGGVPRGLSPEEAKKASQRWGYSPEKARQALEGMTDIHMDMTKLERAVDMFEAGDEAGAASLVWSLRGSANAHIFPDAWSNMESEHEITLDILEETFNAAERYINNEIEMWAERAAMGYIEYLQTSGEFAELEDYMDLAFPGLTFAGSDDGASPYSALRYKLTNATRVALDRDHVGRNGPEDLEKTTGVAGNALFVNITKADLDAISPEQVPSFVSSSRNVFVKEYMEQNTVNETQANNVFDGLFPTDEAFMAFAHDVVGAQVDASAEFRTVMKNIFGHDRITDDMSGQELVAIVDAAMPGLEQGLSELEFLIQQSYGFPEFNPNLQDLRRSESGMLQATTLRADPQSMVSGQLIDIAPTYKALFGEEPGYMVSFDAMFDTYDGTLQTLPPEIMELAGEGVVEFVEVTPEYGNAQYYIPVLSQSGMLNAIAKLTEEVGNLTGYRLFFDTRGYTPR